ncbi:MAG TPA: hypothetical protein EYN91_02795 [Candidatus Melainabacteria bacterium]|mgnify:CR=1 FL=1|jgi:hypothetical protein|nr:hypothetical protein [Candidatus Melainabacteria bacterium]HIN67574.1 hypothetical protein [Candidatus Obscuribacterales bacterium]
MSAETNKLGSFFEQVKEFVLIFGGNFAVLILLLVVVNYFLAPFDIKGQVSGVSQEITYLRADVATLLKEVRELKAAQKTK